MFDPDGYVGVAYWYLFSPVHRFVFSSMLHGIGRAVGGFNGSAQPL